MHNKQSLSNSLNDTNVMKIDVLFTQYGWHRLDNRQQNMLTYVHPHDWFAPFEVEFYTQDCCVVTFPLQDDHTKNFRTRFFQFEDAYDYMNQFLGNHVEYQKSRAQRRQQLHDESVCYTNLTNTLEI